MLYSISDTSLVFSNFYNFIARYIEEMGVNAFLVLSIPV